MLRRIADHDVDFIFGHFRDPDVCRYLVDAEPVSSRDEAQEIIDWCNGSGNQQSSRQNRWLIIWQATGAAIGTIGFHSWDRRNQIAEIGYDLSRACWGRGIMTEVMQPVLGFGFNEMELNRVQASVHVQNASSYRLLRRQGFVAEGVVRARHFFRGEYHDHFLLSLLRRDPGACCLGPQHEE